MSKENNNMKTFMQKPIIDAEEFMKFVEDTTGAKFLDAETDQPALDILAKQNSEKKSDYDLWLEEQDEETKKPTKWENLGKIGKRIQKLSSFGGLLRNST